MNTEYPLITPDGLKAVFSNLNAAYRNRKIVRIVDFVNEILTDFVKTGKTDSPSCNVDYDAGSITIYLQSDVIPYHDNGAYAITQDAMAEFRAIGHEVGVSEVDPDRAASYFVVTFYINRGKK